MIHEHRVIPIRRSTAIGAGRQLARSPVESPLLSPAIQLYMGDARGHWEGDTLVVETRNFNGRIGPAPDGGGVPNSPGMVLTERFHRVSEETMQYVATVRDPATWVGPWTVSFTLRLNPEYGMYEYACHEGNYSLRNALGAARAAER
jgi:hypothetical protein